MCEGPSEDRQLISTEHLELYQKSVPLGRFGELELPEEHQPESHRTNGCKV